MSPIARQFEADLYLPTGEISDTLVYQIARDADADGRPLVMSTLSDCDPAGHQLPISIARKLQASRDLFFPDLKFEGVRIALPNPFWQRQDVPPIPLSYSSTSHQAERAAIAEMEIPVMRD